MTFNRQYLSILIYRSVISIIFLLDESLLDKVSGRATGLFTSWFRGIALLAVRETPKAVLQPLRRFY